MRKMEPQAYDMMADASPDVVVTDLIMPEMDGMELVAQNW